MNTAANRAAPGPTLGQSNRSRIALRRNLEGWLFASPWVIGFLLWTLGPMLASFVLAFSEWDLVSPPRWVGLRNIRDMAQDALVLQSLKVTTLYAISSVP